MEHPFTWYALLPHDWQANLPQHTFFALVSALFVLLFAWRGRVALARAQDPAVPAADLGTRNIAELLIGLVVSQSDAIIGRQGRKFVPFFGTFFLFILFSNLIGLLPGFSPPTSDLNTTVALALVSFIGYNVIGIKEMGAGYLKHFVGPMTGLPAQSFLGKLAFVPLLLLSVVFFFVLEFVSHSISPGFSCSPALRQHDGRPYRHRSFHGPHQISCAGNLLCSRYTRFDHSSCSLYAVEHDLC